MRRPVFLIWQFESRMAHQQNSNFQGRLDMRQSR